MKKYLPLGRLVFSVLSFLLFGLLIQYAFHSPRAAKPFPESPKTPQLILKKSVIVGWDHGERLWEFQGDTLLVDYEGRFLTYQGRGIGQAFFQNKPFLKIQAPEIRFDLFTKNVQALKGVVLSAEPDTTLLARELFWEQSEQRLLVPGKVFIQSKLGKFWGRHLEFLAYQGRLKISGVRMMYDFMKLPHFK